MHLGGKRAKKAAHNINPKEKKSERQTDPSMQVPTGIEKRRGIITAQKP